MSSRLHVLRFDRLVRRKVHITEQLRLEEALFRADDRNWCIINTGMGGRARRGGSNGVLASDDYINLSSYDGQTPTIVLGISGKPAKLTDLSRVRREKLPLFRRFTGGGTVVVDEGTTFISLVCNKAAGPLPARATVGPRELMRWSAFLYARALAQCGLQVSENFDETVSSDGSGFQGFREENQIITNCCNENSAYRKEKKYDDKDGVPLSFKLKENDYVLGDKKFAGNAQGLSRDRFVHHTSVLWDFDPDTMSVLSNPERQPDYRRHRSHDNFLCKLCEVLPRRDALPDAIIHELDSMGFDILEMDPDDPYLAEVLLRKHHKSNSHVNADNEKLATGLVQNRWE